ncbi:hypothetical protein Desde_3203 [Desulfitobacterium dehalogenans ATCC 51507]|uniref:Uncharacterized protein n=1 Tax=Desulfitobacterium dehalogenans (strain ATCC 51507 / DSM 9161 / JW/IU-DC1) TaxID=756499 RepID=I4AC09_DESDJ|nr:hypothetical protein [Desulfitobacterium dehalogenans]AFM01494.1 hypothetical protein Desde_3203 [Desulfitobacterium dehalogenans ATCC 51507]
MELLTALGAYLFFGTVGVGIMGAGFKYHQKHGGASTMLIGFSLQFYIFGMVMLVPKLPNLLESILSQNIDISGYINGFWHLFVGIILLVLSGVASVIYNRQKNKKKSHDEIKLKE